MNAEIKTNNKILINRLDDSERILLKNIFTESTNPFKKILFKEIYDDCGDFGGLFVNVEDEPNIFNRTSNITMVKGNDRIVEWKFYSADDTEITEELDEVIFTCKADKNDLEAVFQFTKSNGDITKREDGFYQMTIPVNISELLHVGNYYFEITMLKNTTPLMKQTTVGNLIVLGNEI